MSFVLAFACALCQKQAFDKLELKAQGARKLALRELHLHNLLSFILY